MPLFALSVPPEMVTGKVVVRAQATDENVRAVKWVVDDWARLTLKPFELTFDAGPIPYERRVTAVALDKDRRPLYRQEAVLNAGGRSLRLEFHSPLDGQNVRGTVRVEVQARTPTDDEPDSVVLEAGGDPMALSPAGSGSFVGTVDVHPATTALVARLRTRRGRETERTILVNGRGVLAESDAHVVEQLVGVFHHGRPLLGLGREDFRVRDEKGACEVRDAQLLTDVPLAIGFAIDNSISLRHAEALKETTAHQFIEECLTDKDTGFLLAFGPAVVRVRDWTRSREALQDGILSLDESSVPGTPLYEAILMALHQFQGQQGARALVLVTDGYDFDGDVALEDALTYARESGVTIYALGLTSSYETVTAVTRHDPNRNAEVVEAKTETVIQPPNVEVLSRFADATGGKLYLVKKASDLPGIFAEIKRDIRTQYLVSYVSAARQSWAFHPVEVSARHGKVRTASGFFY